MTRATITGRARDQSQPFTDIQPGDFTFGHHHGDDRDPPKWFRFGCPRGRGECYIPISPQTFGNGHTWKWNGDRKSPTFTPSVNCRSQDENGKPLAGCGWHGWIDSGNFREAG